MDISRTKLSDGLWGLSSSLAFRVVVIALTHGRAKAITRWGLSSSLAFRVVVVAPTEGFHQVGVSIIARISGDGVLPLPRTQDEADQ